MGCAEGAAGRGAGTEGDNRLPTPSDPAGSAELKVPAGAYVSPRVCPAMRVPPGRATGSAKGGETEYLTDDGP
jgi:hypothetical protein